MPPPGIIEALDIIEHVSFDMVSRAVRLARRAFVFSEEKKLSIAALSQTLPPRLRLQVTPWSARSRWKGSLVYWLPRSE